MVSLIVRNGTQWIYHPMDLAQWKPSRRTFRRSFATAASYHGIWLAGPVYLGVRDVALASTYCVREVAMWKDSCGKVVIYITECAREFSTPVRVHTV